ncbi:MAG TPA: oligopeptide/dipeptide ABC transporter ATP-binding protein, partial [Gaiellaceae bacterium]
YAGRIVESGPRAELLRHPRHPYTRALLDALPHPEAARDTPLVAITGTPPSPQQIPVGCPYHPRCPYAIGVCIEEDPPLAPVDGRRLACHVDPFRDGE